MIIYSIPFSFQWLNVQSAMQKQTNKYTILGIFFSLHVPAYRLLVISADWLLTLREKGHKLALESHVKL